MKPFTIRKVDYNDKRFRALSQWTALPATIKWGIRETNPATGESFIREIKSVSYLAYHDFSSEHDDYLGYLKMDYSWRVILMGERLDDNPDIQG